MFCGLLEVLSVFKSTENHKYTLFNHGNTFSVTVTLFLFSVNGIG